MATARSASSPLVMAHDFALCLPRRPRLYQLALNQARFSVFFSSSSQKNLKSLGDSRCLISNDTLKNRVHERISSEAHFPPLAEQLPGPNQASARQKQRHDDVQAGVRGEQHSLRRIGK